MPPPRASIEAAISIRSATRPSSYARESCRPGSSGRTIATAPIADRRERVWGRPASAIFRIVSTSRITMNRHGCSFLLLPDQRATSVIASSSPSVSGSSVNSRIWRVRIRGRTRSIAEAGIGAAGAGGPAEWLIRAP